ncbi:hypothetical protein GWI33_021804 [Rhynchophorus ferrugineus]|uniref:Uncharacterized protein n=1 Tax=Rhynchophorus ferrugineus TaxID=354439 RepID=A0A834IP65_RHYFE|nr:hypothetical protein GWI33_021804 [Rhynchophorus ferrugineus]
MCYELRRHKYIFSSNLVLIKSLFVLSCLTLLVAECKRQRRDIRHMIILTDEYKPPIRYKKYEGREKTSKKPDISSYEDNLTSGSSLEQYIPIISNKKVKPKKPKKGNYKRSKRPHTPRRNKKQNKPNNNNINQELLPDVSSYNTLNSQDSQELLLDTRYHAPSHPNGKIIFPENIDITTTTPNYYAYSSGTEFHPTMVPNYYRYNINQNDANIKTDFRNYEPLDYKTIPDDYQTINLKAPYHNHQIEITSTITPDKDVKTVLSSIYEPTDLGNLTANKINQKPTDTKKENTSNIVFGARMKRKHRKESKTV